jgi:hypothetical protein
MAVSLAALSREVGVATEMLLTKAEQVSDDGACAAGLRLIWRAVCQGLRHEFPGFRRSGV